MVNYKAEKRWCRNSLRFMRRLRFIQNVPRMTSYYNFVPNFWALAGFAPWMILYAVFIEFGDWNTCERGPSRYFHLQHSLTFTDGGNHQDPTVLHAETATIIAQMNECAVMVLSESYLDSQAPGNFITLIGAFSIGIRFFWWYVSESLKIWIPVHSDANQKTT